LSIIRIDQTSTMYIAFDWLGSFVRIINMNVNTKLSLRVYIFQILRKKKIHMPNWSKNNSISTSERITCLIHTCRLLFIHNHTYV